MIKNWLKNLICIVAIITVSLFFVLDSLTNVSAGTSSNPTDIVFNDVPIDDDSSNTDPSSPTESQDEKNEPIVSIPEYKNGYTCITDAYSRFDNTTKYKSVLTSSGSPYNTSISAISNIKQTVKSINIHNGTEHSLEVFAYSSSSFAKKFYEKIYTKDMQTFDFTYTTDIDSNNNYNLSNATQKTLDWNGLMQYCSESILSSISLRVTKNVDKLSKFDRDSDDKYYIAAFSLNVNKLPAQFITSMKKEAGASSLSFYSIYIEYYISKITGQIAKINMNQKMNMDVGISLDLDYYATTIFTY